jgi:hypothetical protein
MGLPVIHFNGRVTVEAKGEDLHPSIAPALEEVTDMVQICSHTCYPCLDICLSKYWEQLVKWVESQNNLRSKAFLYPF